MRYSEIFKEARRLHGMGLAIHWLHARSKRPIESGWTSGPRKEWDYLAETYTADLNVGVRLGTPSRFPRGFLAVVDVDIKSKDPAHRSQALEAARALLGDARCPEVRSGRGNGSRHFYCLTERPFKTFNPAQSTETVKVHMPSKRPSKAELRELTEEEIHTGIRLSHAWEISLYSDGRQVVLPPSVHPDSGELYRWKTHLTAVADLPVILFETAVWPDIPEDAGVTGLGGEGAGSVREAHIAAERSEAASLDFKVEPVELAWLPISDEVRQAITKGVGVTDRSGYLLRASSALVSAGLSVNEVLTVLTDPNTFLGACGYEHAGNTKSRRKAAEWVYRYTLKKVSTERDASNVFTKAPPPARKLSAEEMEAQAEEFAEARHWTQDLVRTANGKGPPQKLIQNVVLIMKNAVSEEVLKRDLFAYRDTYSCNTPWGGLKGEIVGNDDVHRIKYWLGHDYGFEPSDNVVEGALVELACQNAYDPVVEMLDALPEWDGVERLDSWLKENFEARGDEDYLGQVFSKWMIAMVMRVYRPGAKFDWMPIFEGAQGIGKSSFGRLLVGERYFLDWLPNLHDKESALSLQGMWGVEMGELSQFRKNELETIKAFLTRTVDKMRPPYGRRMIESPRRCVFFGTTNRETYLVDETGNRRFKPVIVGSLNFKALRRERIQLFAEARARYLDLTKTGEEIILEIEGDARIYEKKIQSKKMVEDDSNAMAEAMEIFVEKVVREDLKFDFEKFRTLELFEGGGPLTKWKPENRNFQFAAKMLRKLGAESRPIQGKPFWKMPIKASKQVTPHPVKKRNDVEDVTFM